MGSGLKDFLKVVLNYRDDTIFYVSLLISFLTIFPLALWSLWGVLVSGEIWYTGVTAWWTKDYGCVFTTEVFLASFIVTFLVGVGVGWIVSKHYGNQNYWLLSIIVAFLGFGVTTLGLMGVWALQIFYQSSYGMGMFYFEVVSIILAVLSDTSFNGFVLNAIWR